MKIFVSARITPEWVKKLEERFDEVEHYDWSKHGLLPSQELVEKMKGLAVVITESDEITAEMLQELPDLAILVDCRGTVVNVDLETANKNDTVVVNTPGRNADAVADLTVAMMIMTARNVISGYHVLKDGSWYENGKRWAYVTHQGYDLPGKKVGLIGLGHIGRLVAERLKGFRVKLLAYDPFIKEETAEKMGIRLVDLETLMKESDFVSLHLPDNEQTKGLIGEKELSLMKPESFLINTARAAVIEEDILIKFLEEKKIRGAALDVYHEEPLPPDSPLLHMPHVICLPHLGGASLDVQSHQSRIAVESLFGLLDGNPQNIINPQALKPALEKLKKYEKEKG